jgi:O-succinylbenzoate synthase
VVAEVRRRHPDILLSVDANAAYTLEDRDRLRKLDEFGLLMIEQPLETRRSASITRAFREISRPRSVSTRASRGSAPPARRWSSAAAESST